MSSSTSDPSPLDEFVDQLNADTARRAMHTLHPELMAEVEHLREALARVRAAAAVGEEPR